MNLGREILKVRRYGGASVFAYGDKHFDVLPSSLKFLDVPPVAIISQSQAKGKPPTELSIRGRTELFYPPELQYEIEKALLGYDENLTASSIRLSIIQPDKVTGCLNVPKKFKTAAVWTFTASPIGLWPGRFDIKLSAGAAEEFLDWWKNDAYAFSVSYNVFLSQSKTTSYRRELNSGSMEHKSNGRTTTRDAFEALKAKISVNPQSEIGFTITTKLNLSAKDRHHTQINFSI